MKENEFQGWIISTAKSFGWRVWHVPTPMRPIGGSRFVPDPRGRGLCDLILMHPDPPRLVFAEVKGHDGVLSDDQKEFLGLARGVQDRLRREGVPFERVPFAVYTWRPGVEQLIEDVLRGSVLT